jgi:hypothetical protein
VDEEMSELIHQPNAWHNSDGQVLMLCAIEEMHPLAKGSKQAVTVIGGLAICQDHMEKAIDALRAGQPITQIVMQALAGEF